MAVFTNELRLDASPFVSSLKKVLTEAQAAASNVENTFKNIEPQIDTSNAKKAFGVLETEAKKTSSNIKAELSEGFKGLGSSITGGIIGGGVASGVQAGAQLIVSAFKSVIDTGSEFQTNIANLQAITGASGPVLDDLSNRARDLAKQFGGDATTQVQSFQTILSKFGPALANTPEELGTFSTNVNTLAKAAGLDAKGAVDALSNSMLQFGIDASDPARLAAESGRFINVLAASAKEGAAEIPQVSEAILQAGVAAKGANLSFEETNAAIQALAIGGKVGSEAGVGLRNVLGLLIKQSGPGAEALKGVGLSVEGLGQTLTTKGLSAALVELRGGIDKLGTDAEKAAFKATLFGSENAATAGILLDQADAIADLTGKITGTQEAFTQAEVNMATFSEFVSRAQANISDFAITIFNAFGFVASAFGEVLGPTVGSLVDELGGYFENLWTIVKPILMLIGGAIFANLVQIFQVAANTVKVVYGIISRLLQGFINAFRPVKDAIAAAFGADGPLGEGLDVVQAFKDGLKLFGEVLSSIADVLIGIGGIVVEFVVTPFQILGNIIAAVITKFREWFGSQKENNKESEKGKGIIDRLREAFVNIRGTISGVTSAFQEVKKTIGDFFNALASFDLKKAIDAFSGFGEKVAQAYDRGFNEVAGGAGDQAAKQAQKTGDEIVTTAKKVEEATKKSAKGTDDALKKANELFAARERILKSEQETATTAILRQGLDKDAEKVALKKLELDTQKQITKAYLDTFKAVTQVDSVTGEEQVVRVGFKTDDKQLADINTKVQNFFQAEIRLEAELALKPDELEKNVQKSLKFFNESFKKNAKELTEGIIDPLQFQTSLEGLRGSFASLRQSLSDALNTAEVQASPALLAAYEEQILLVNLKLAELNAEAIEATDKAFIASQKTQLEINKRRLEVLKTDERAHGEEIRRILEDNIALETNLKLAAIRSTGQAREDETRLILREAQKQADALEGSGKESGGVFKGLAKDFSKVITGLDFTEVFETTKEQATETADTIVDSLKSGTIAYQDAVAELDSIATDSSSVLDTLFKKLSDSFQKIADASIDSLSSISSGFDGSQKDIEELLSATASAAAAGFAAILVSGEEFGKGFVLLILDILDATIPALVALILGQSLAANPLAGAVIGAALIATLKGAVAFARSAANGFEEGGYTGNMGTKAIAGVVHGQEFVMHAKATKQFRPVLEQMNRGHMPMIDNGEFSAMRSELSAIRKRLDGMPNGIQGSQAVRLDVGFDNYIYERDRRRVAVRGLRG